MQTMIKIAKSVISDFSQKMEKNLLTFYLPADLPFFISHFFNFLFRHAKKSNRKTTFKLFGKWQYVIGLFADKGLQKCKSVRLGLCGVAQMKSTSQAHYRA